VIGERQYSSLARTSEADDGPDYEVFDIPG
jgi:hypothetical protein